MPAQQKCAQFAARRAPARSQPHSPTMDHESMSLRPTSKPMYENLKTQFARLHPAEKPPSNVEFQPPPYCKVVNADTNQPVTVTSEVTEIVGWPSDDGSKIRFEISTPAEDLNPFWSWMQATFGVGGKIADSLEKNYSAMGTISTPTTRVLAKRCLVVVVLLALPVPRVCAVAGTDNHCARALQWERTNRRGLWPSGCETLLTRTWRAWGGKSHWRFPS